MLEKEDLTISGRSQLPRVHQIADELKSCRHAIRRISTPTESIATPFQSTTLIPKEESRVEDRTLSNSLSCEFKR